MKRHRLFSIFSVLLGFGALFSSAQDTSLHMAILDGDRTGVATLLENGADINSKMRGGWTPLMVSVKYGHFDIMKDLLQSNAQINMRDNKGNTALILAVTSKRIEAVRILLANQADVALKNNSDMSAMDIALLTGANEISTLLNDYLNQKG